MSLAASPRRQRSRYGVDATFASTRARLGQRWLGVGALLLVVGLVAAVVSRAARQPPSVVIAASGLPHSPRSGSARGHAGRPVTIDWVGDIALSPAFTPAGLSAALAPVASVLRGADITAGNLEGTLSVGGVSKCAGRSASRCFAFQASPALAGELHAAGFDLLNQANNHALDSGRSGQQQTLSALRSHDLAYTGLPGQISVLRAHGIRVAFVGFAPYPYTASLLDIPGAQALVRAALRRAPLVIVIIHAGAEGSDATHVPTGEETFLGENRGDTRAFAQAMVSAGAAAVLGSGPHVLRGIEDDRGHPIAYSAGNFIGWHTLGGGGLLSESVILRITLRPDRRLTAGRIFSLQLNNGLPRPDPQNAASKLIATLSREDFPAAHFTIDNTGNLRP